MFQAEPFLRWAGGKTWLIKHLSNVIGDSKINHYHEPFLGGAAIFFSMETHYKSYLSDVNEELISTYSAVKENPHAVIENLLQFSNTKEDYYRVRSIDFDNLYERAAQFIYLNQTSFNGIYRVNRNGKYNVPYGFRTNMVYDMNRIIEASKKLQNVRLSHGDFTCNKYRIKQNDLVFLDPPYTVSHNNIMGLLSIIKIFFR